MIFILLQENFEYIEHVVLSGTESIRSERDFTRRDAYIPRTKPKDSYRSSYNYFSHSRKSNSHSSERTSSRYSPEYVVTENKTKNKRNDNGREYRSEKGYKEKSTSSEKEAFRSKVSHKEKKPNVNEIKANNEACRRSLSNEAIGANRGHQNKTKLSDTDSSSSSKPDLTKSKPLHKSASRSNSHSSQHCKTEPKPSKASAKTSEIKSQVLPSKDSEISETKPDCKSSQSLETLPSNVSFDHSVTESFQKSGESNADTNTNGGYSTEHIGNGKDSSTKVHVSDENGSSTSAKHLALTDTMKERSVSAYEENNDFDTPKRTQSAESKEECLRKISDSALAENMKPLANQPSNLEKSTSSASVNNSVEKPEIPKPSNFSVEALKTEKSCTEPPKLLNPDSQKLPELLQTVKIEKTNPTLSFMSAKTASGNNKKSDVTQVVNNQAAYSPYQLVQLNLPVPINSSNVVVPINLANAVTVPPCFYVPVAESNVEVPPTSNLSKENNKKIDKPAKEKNRNRNNNNTVSCFSHVLDELQENRSGPKSDSTSNSASNSKKKVKKTLEKKVIKPVRVKSKVLSIRPSKSSASFMKTHDVNSHRRIRHFRTPQRIIKKGEYEKKLIEAVHLSLQKGKENSIKQQEKKEHSSVDGNSSANYETEFQDKLRRSFEKDVPSRFEKDANEPRWHDTRRVVHSVKLNQQQKNPTESRSQGDQVSQNTMQSAKTPTSPYSTHDVHQTYTSPYSHQAMPEETPSLAQAMADKWNYQTQDQHHFPPNVKPGLLGPYPNAVSDHHKPGLLGPYPNHEFAAQLKHWKPGDPNSLNAMFEKNSRNALATQQAQFWPQNSNAINSSAETFEQNEEMPFHPQRAFAKPFVVTPRGRYNDYYRSKSVQRARSYFYKPNRYHYYAKNYSVKKKESETSATSADKTSQEKSPEKTTSEVVANATPKPKLAGHKELVRRVKPKLLQDENSKKLVSSAETALSDIISFFRKNHSEPKETSQANDCSKISDPSISDNKLCVQITSADTVLPDPTKEAASELLLTKSRREKSPEKEVTKKDELAENADKEELFPSFLNEFVTLDEEWEDNDSIDSFNISQDDDTSLSKNASIDSQKSQRKETTNDASVHLRSKTKIAKEKKRVIKADNGNRKNSNNSQENRPKTPDITLKKLLEKVEQDDLNEVEKIVGMFLKSKKQKRTVKWPFIKRGSGWNDVFLDFSLNIDRKVNDFVSSKESSEIPSQDRLKNPQPMQWKKKLIEQIDMNAFVDIPPDLSKGITQDVESLKSDVLSTMSKVLSVVERNTIEPTKQEMSTPLPAKQQPDIARTSDQCRTSTVSKTKKKTKLNSTANIFDSIATLQTSTLDISLENDTSSSHLRKGDLFQMFSQKSVLHHYGGKPSRPFLSRQDSNGNGLPVQGNDPVFQQQGNFAKKSVTAGEKTVDGMIMDEKRRGGPNVNQGESSRSRNYAQFARSNSLVDSKPLHQFESHSDDDASTYVPDEGEKSSDETLSDSEKIPLRSYAKVPLWNNQDLLKAWDVKKCVVNVEKLAACPNSQRNNGSVASLFQIALQKLSLSPSGSDNSGNPLLTSSVTAKVMKAKKSIYRPSRSLFQENKQETACEDNEAATNRANKVVSSDQISGNDDFIPSAAEDVPAYTGDKFGNSKDPESKAKTLDKDRGKTAVSKSTAKPRTSRSVTRSSARIQKRRTELPSVSSDEDELPDSVEEKVNPELKTTAPSVKEKVTPELKATAPLPDDDVCSDDDILLISCKPYLSKNKEKDRKDGTKPAKSNSRAKSDKANAIPLPRPNKARKRAASKSVHKNIIPVTKELRLSSKESTTLDTTATTTATHVTSRIQEVKTNSLKNIQQTVSTISVFFVHFVSGQAYYVCFCFWHR